MSEYEQHIQSAHPIRSAQCDEGPTLGVVAVKQSLLLQLHRKLAARILQVSMGYSTIPVAETIQAQEDSTEATTCRPCSQAASC